MTAIVITGMACSAMLLSVSHCVQASSQGSSRFRAVQVAQDLILEIQAARWADPNAPGNWGTEQGEDDRNKRTHFDDLDDYDGWHGVPQTKDGYTYQSIENALSNTAAAGSYAGIECYVRVSKVNRNGVVLSRSKSSRYRQVEVEIRNGSRVLHKETAFFVDIKRVFEGEQWYDPDQSYPDPVVEELP